VLLNGKQRHRDAAAIEGHVVEYKEDDDEGKWTHACSVARTENSSNALQVSHYGSAWRCCTETRLWV